MDNSNSPKTVADLGEDGLIQRISKYLAPADEMLVVPPPGDDAAAVRVPSGYATEVLTTDLLVEGTHFLRNASTCWNSVGRRAMVANLSDLAAMGAVPGCALISLGVPSDFPVNAVEDLYGGFAKEATVHHLRLVGGDTVRSPHVVVNIAVTGYKVAGHAECRRSDCRPEDWLYVSNPLGGCRAGLELLLNGQATLEEEPLIRRQQVPVPRLALGQRLAASLPRVGMMDISDGLMIDLPRLGAASQVGFEIRQESFPLFPGVEVYCAKTGRDPYEFALFSGEEFELLFCCDIHPTEIGTAIDWDSTGCLPYCIGYAIPGDKINFRRESSELVDIRESGFHHFDTM